MTTQNGQVNNGAAQNAGQGAAKNAGQGAGKKAAGTGQRIPTYFGNKRFNISYSKKTWMLVLGVILILGGIRDIFATAMNIAFRRYTVEFEDIPVDLFLTGAGFYLVYLYFENKNRYGRYVQLIDVTMGKIPIANIAYHYPTSYENAVRDLQKMINSKILYGAFIDRNEGMLVLNVNNPNVEQPVAGTQPVVPAGTAAGTAAAAEAVAREEKNVRSASWTHIMDPKTVIKDPDINLRVNRIDTTLAGIKAKVDEDKSLRDDYDLNLFIDFYIPKIKMLLADYQKIEQVNDQRRQAQLKSDLIETLDALDGASMNLWNKMVNSDVVNMTTELDALKNKLEMDGFNESDFETKEKTLS